ncbi:MAG: restriction endonuclease subunit S [Saprospiraceae bacterium]|jgi:type I restriction enzyme S subunit|nr:restriction endonuclease subunit S [Saprospiraceae bacterium]
MKTNTNIYPSYKHSGVEWLGEVPEHWENIRMKHLFRDYSEKNKPNEELLSVTQNQGVVPRTWVENRMVMPSGALESFKFINKGDFAISLRSFEGGLEYCHHDGIISPAYTVLKTKRIISELFYKYLFKSFSFISELQTSVVGIREGKNISYPELSYSFLPVPPLPEQTAIATFLDRKTALIDQAIGIKQKQIELLKERRQILIHKAVTRGLNPNVKMKDSGVEWIGEIPEDWEVKKIKQIVEQSFSGGTPSTDKLNFWDGGIPWASSVDIKTDYLCETTREISLMGLNRSSAKIVPKGAILFVTRSGILQHTFAITISNIEMAINQDIKCLILSNDILPEYFQKIIKGNNSQILVEVRQQAATVESIDMEAFFNLSLPLPKCQEQKRILEYIESTTTKIASAISLKEKEIEKLKEYKATLINSAVTGKIKVI